MRLRHSSATAVVSLVLLLWGTASCTAQAGHPARKAGAATLQAQQNKAEQIQAGQTSGTPQAADQAPAPPTPLRPVDQPPELATVTLLNGKLLVKADNSSLIQILNELGSTGGMSISGLGQDQRVFGDYGPGDPRQILSELLDGAGYNVLMVGETREGTPRQLVLTTSSDAPPSPPQSFPQQTYAPPQPPSQPPGRPEMRWPVGTPTPREKRQRAILRQRERELSQPHP